MEYLSFVHPAVYWTAGLILLATIVLHFVWRAHRPPRPLRERVKPLPAGVADADPDKVASWSGPSVSRTDRRKSGRRGGPLTPVEVTGGDPGDGPVEPAEGVVVDRSANGLCVATAGPYPDGITLHLRPEASRGECPWVAVLVRNCRAQADYFLLGVEFLAPPPLNVRLQFG